MWHYLYGWTAVWISVPILIGIGIGVLSMTPPEPRVAQTCFTLAIVILLSKLTWWIVAERTDGLGERALFIAIVFGASGALWFAGWMLAESRVASASAARIPFSVVSPGGLFSSPSDQFTGIWATFSGTKGISRAPVSALVELAIVNQQAQAAAITNFIIDAKTLDGAWLRVARLNGGSIRLFMAAQNELTTAASLRPTMLDVMLADRAIGPHETVKGFVVLCYPRLSKPKTMTGDYRVTIQDTEGHSSTVEVQPSNDSIVGAKLPFDGDRSDISRLALVFIQDLPGYWVNQR